LLIISHRLFFMYWPGCPNQPRIDFSNYKYVPRLICLPMCLGCITLLYPLISVHFIFGIFPLFWSVFSQMSRWQRNYSRIPVKNAR
jgi:hypothetical protein